MGGLPLPEGRGLRAGGGLLLPEERGPRAGGGLPLPKGRGPRAGGGLPLLEGRGPRAGGGLPEGRGPSVVGRLPEGRGPSVVGGLLLPRGEDRMSWADSHCRGERAECREQTPNAEGERAEWCKWTLVAGRGPSVQSTMTPTTRRGSQVVDLSCKEERRREKRRTQSFNFGN